MSLPVIGNGPSPEEGPSRTGIDPDAVRKHGEAGWVQQYKPAAIIIGCMIAFVLAAWAGAPFVFGFIIEPLSSNKEAALPPPGKTPSRGIEIAWRDDPPPEPTPPPTAVLPKDAPPEPVVVASIVPANDAPSDRPVVKESAPVEPDGGPFEAERKPGYGPIAKKAAVMGAAPEDDGYAKSALMNEKWLGCVIQPGYVLAANLINAINSEVPGQAMLELREPYYSPDDPFADDPLLPAGTRFVASYSSKEGAGSKLGHTRIDLKVVAATTPTPWRPRRLALEDKRIAVLSGDGSMGLGGEVQENLFNILVYGGVMALIDSTSRAATEEESLGGRVTGSASERYGDIGREYVERNFETAPTIKIKAGERVLLLFSDGVLASDKCRT